MVMTAPDRTQDAAAGPPKKTRRNAPGKRVWTASTGWLILMYLLPAIVMVGLFIYYPMATGMQMAFRNWNLNDLTDTAWVGFQNFIDMFNESNWGITTRNSVVWVVGSIVPQFLIGFTLAMWLRTKFRFRGAYQALVFYPWAVSGFLIGILFRWMFNSEFGVVNDLLMKMHVIDAPIMWLADPELAMTAMIIANVWYGVTFFAIMLLAALQSVPDELLEAAALDGAGKTRTLFNVIIPYIQTTIALTILLRVIWIFNAPDVIYAMTGGGPAGQTHIITSWMIEFTQKGDYGHASALGVIVTALLLAFAGVYLASMRKKEKHS